MSKSSRANLTDEERKIAERLFQKVFTFRNFSIGLKVDVPGIGTFEPTKEYKQKVRELFKLLKKNKKVGKLAKKYKHISLHRLNKVVYLSNTLSLPKFNVKRKKKMSTKVPESKGGNFESLPNGAYAAVCYGVAILGKIEKEFKGKKTKTLQVRIFFDIPEEKYSYEKDGETIVNTYTVSHQITFSSSTKGNLYKLLNTWSGGQINEKNIVDFDIATMVGKTALITIETTEKGDKAYTNLKGVTTIPKGMNKPQTKREKFVFDVDNFDPEKFKMLPKFVMQIVATSEEFVAKKLRLEDYLSGNGEANEESSNEGSENDDWG